MTTIIAGMIQVSKEQFFAVIGPMNVHPSNTDPQRTAWEMPNRQTVGISYPGWKDPMGAKAWFLAERYAPRATGRPGDMAAAYAEETGIDYSTALAHCNMD